MKILKRRKIVLFIVLVIGIIAIIPLYLVFWNLKNDYKEKVIDREFHTDINQYPNIKIDNFMLWEGDSMVNLEIPDKGKVHFWYGVDRVPRIEAIGKYNTSFTCFNVDKNNKKVSYAYDTDLWLDSTSPYKKWFPFQVNTIGDLITHYSDIEKVLDTFPLNSNVVELSEQSGKRQMLQTSNPDFLIKPSNSVVCDLYFNN